VLTSDVIGSRLRVIGQVKKGVFAVINFSTKRAGIRIAVLITVVTAAAVTVPVAAGDKVGGGPDETPAQAQPIAQNKVVAGAFQGSSDYFDYYSFHAKAGQTLTFTLKDTTSPCTSTNDPDQDGCPVYGWLADSSNHQLGGPSSSAGGNTSVGKNGAYPQQNSWSWKFSQTGTFYIGLTDDQDPRIPAGSPTYTIQYTVTSTSSKSHHRTISLSVKRGITSLKFQGQLSEDTGFRPCTSNQPVQIQRKSSTGWLTIAHTTTGTASKQGPANYSVSASASPGTYRAVAPQTTAGSATCDAAVSTSVVVSVAKHPRTVVLQGVFKSANGAAVAGYVKATDHFGRCAKHVPVIAQRRRGTGWVKVGSGTTLSLNAGRARFNIRVPLRSGTYRVVAPRHRADPLDVCLKAVSNKVTRAPRH
jgi:hypothetical protein